MSALFGLSVLGCSAAPEGEGPIASSQREPLSAKEPVLVLHATMVQVAALESLVDRLEQEGYEVRTAEAPDLFTHSVEQSAEFIAEAVRNVRSEFPDQKLRIVAACNGGMATQYYLKLLAGAEHGVSHFVSFESAHQGTLEAPLWSVGTRTMFRYPGLGDLVDAVIDLARTGMMVDPTKEEVFSGLRDVSRASLYEAACGETRGVFSSLRCWLLHRKLYRTLPQLVDGLVSVMGGPTDGSDRHVDEVLRAILMELYVADHYFANPGNPRGYDLDPDFGIFKQQMPPNDTLSRLKGEDLPGDISATSIYSCLDYAMIPYDTSYLNGATNVVICPWAPRAVWGGEADEVINEVSLHWSMYYQPFVVDRIVEALSP